MRAVYSMSVDVGILMALAKPHQRLMRPGIVVKHGDLDDARLERGMSAFAAAASDRLQLRQQSSGLITSGSNLIWNEAFAGQISVTPLNLAPSRTAFVTDKRLEEGLERHLLVALNEDVFIASIANIAFSLAAFLLHELSLCGLCSRAMAQASVCGIAPGEHRAPPSRDADARAPS